MTLQELRKAIAKGEGQYVEFKKKVDHPSKIVREMVAFANSGGGQLFLGIEDNGHISGLPYPEEDLYVMEAALNQYVKPELTYDIARIKVTAKEEVLVYSVPSGLAKPFYWLADKEKGTFRAYVRHADQSLQASKEMFLVLKTDPNRPIVGTFQLNALEKKLLAYLEENKTITLPDFVQLSKLPYWIASKKLVRWVRLGVLEIEPGEGHDVYYLSSSFSSD